MKFITAWQCNRVCALKLQINKLKEITDKIEYVSQSASAKCLRRYTYAKCFRRASAQAKWPTQPFKQKKLWMKWNENWDLCSEHHEIQPQSWLLSWKTLKRGGPKSHMTSRTMAMAWNGIARSPTGKNGSYSVWKDKRFIHLYLRPPKRYLLCCFRLTS